MYLLVSRKEGKDWQSVLLFQSLVNAQDALVKLSRSSDMHWDIHETHSITKKFWSEEEVDAPEVVKERGVAPHVEPEALGMVSYLCDDCADSFGWRWPEHHVATFHTGICDVCKQERSLSCENDWLKKGETKLSDWD